MKVPARQDTAERTPIERKLPVYVIFGEDAFFRRRALAEVLRELFGDEPPGLAMVEVDGPTATVADVLDDCRTASLLAPFRVVCVRDADDFVSANRAILENYLRAPSPCGVLILMTRSWPKGTRLYKLVAEIGRNIACEPLKASEVPGWIASHARAAYGCTVAPDAARRLVELVGPKMGPLDMELAKLATYVAPKKTISPADVDALVGDQREETVFAITDAISRRDSAAALALWDNVISTDRSAPYRAIGGLAWGFRRLAEAKRLILQGLSLTEAARTVRFFGDYAVLRRQLDRFSLHQWQECLVKLLRIDVETKSGLGDVDSAVERFIVELSTAP